ncbi:MAG: ABC transporter substrate-binding protein [Polyangiaceae bacterium]
MSAGERDGAPRLLDRRQFLAAGAAALAACRRSPKPDAASEAGSTDTPRRGGRLRLGVVDDDRIGDLDVHKPSGTGAVIRGFALFSKLWEWSEEMTPRLALAEEAEPNADASTWTIRLRKGLEFHNGKTITADDVVFSVARLTDPQLASPYAALVSPLDRTRIEKLDERTVRIHAKAGLGFVPLPDTWVNFGGIVPTDYHPVTNPVGAGPYRLKEFHPGQRSLFTRFENYFKSGQPYPDELEVIDFKDQTARLAALEDGQLDMINALSPELTPLLTKSSRARLLNSSTYGWQAFNMNLDKPPFDDARVRLAFRLLIDRKELVARVLNGHGRVANDLYSPQDPTFNHDIAQREYDLEQAKSLLKAAGHEGLSIELVAPAAGMNAALVFAEQAKRANVELRVKKVDAATYNGKDKRSFQLSTGSGLGQSFLCTGLNQDAPVAVANRTNFKDPRFGELFLSALKTRDAEARRPLVHEAQRIQHERGGMLIWGFVNALDAVAINARGVKLEHSHFPTWRFDQIWLSGAHG